MSRSTEEGKKEEEKAFKCYFRNSFCPFTSVLIFVCFENIGYQTDKNGHKTLFGFFGFFGFFLFFLCFFCFFCFFPFFFPFFPFFSLFLFFCFFCFFCFVCFLFFSKNYLYHNKQNKKNKNMLSPPLLFDLPFMPSMAEITRFLASSS